MSVPIFIPSWNRDSIVTLKSLPKGLKERVCVVTKTVKQGEKIAEGCKVLTCPVQGRGIHLVRQWLLDRAVKSGLSKLIMLDDDLRLLPGSFEGEKKVFKEDPKSLTKWFRVAEERCLESGVAQTGFSYAYFNTGRDWWFPNRNTSSTYFVNVKAAKDNNLDFLLPSTDDRHFQLSAIEKGLMIWSLSMVVSYQALKQGTGGETSLGNRSEKTRKSYLALAKRYPKYVKVKEDEKYNEPKKTSIGGGLKIVFYMHRMYKAVKRGEDVTKNG